jgi:PTS system ascorbate-specific IIB component
MAIKTIMCCCGSGLGSSLLIRMNVEKALKKMGKTGIEVIHTSLSDANAKSADLFVVGGDLENFTHSFPRVILLSNLMSMAELEGKLAKVFENE